MEHKIYKTVINNSTEDCPSKDYIRLNYIETPDIQGIDTGIPMTSNTYIETTAQYVTFSDSPYDNLGNFLFGCHYSGSYFYFGGAKGYFLASRGKWNEQRNLNTKVKAVDYDKHFITYNFSTGQVTLDDTAVTMTYADNQPYSWMPITILGRTHSNNGSTYSLSTTNCRIRLYSFLIKYGDVVKRDYVPVLRRSDGRVGLYDKISGTFFSSGNTTKNYVAGDYLCKDYGIYQSVVNDATSTKKIYKSIINE